MKWQDTPVEQEEVIIEPLPENYEEEKPEEEDTPVEKESEEEVSSIDEYYKLSPEKQKRYGI